MTKCTCNPVPSVGHLGTTNGIPVIVGPDECPQVQELREAARLKASTTQGDYTLLNALKATESRRGKSKPTPPPPTAQGLDMQMRDLHRRRHALHSACAPYGCVVRYREGVLQQIVEAEENEPKPEAKAALARLRKTIAAMPTREDGV